MHKLTSLLIFIALSASLFGQTDSLSTNNQDSSTVINELQTTTSIETQASGEPAPQLLPEHYLLTQRILWGKYGAMRAVPGFELNEKNRNKEIKIRYYMLKTHRLLGYATLLGMAGQAFTGIKLYNGHREFKDAHESLAGFTNFTYFTSGAMMLFAPPWKTDRAPGYSNTKAHKYLAMVHMSCMIATNIFSDGSEKPGYIRDLHRGTAYAAFGTYFVSSLIIHF